MYLQFLLIMVPGTYSVTRDCTARLNRNCLRGGYRSGTCDCFVFHLNDLFQHVFILSLLDAATHYSMTRSITAMSTVATYKDFKLVEGHLKVTEKEWVKTGKRKQIEKIRNAEIVSILRDTTQKKDDITIRDTVTRCGSGASKDVFMLDNYNFVVKMMTGDKGKNECQAEQQRFDLYKHVVEKEMMYCFGQMFLQKTNTGGVDCFRGNSTMETGDASILLAEKLIITGKSKLTSLFMTMQCTPQAWESYVQMQAQILRLLFRFVHHDVVPWDAKIDNVGLAEAREPHSAPVWVFCDLDGLRDNTEYPNVGGSFKWILQSMLSQDLYLMQPHQNDAITNGWQAPYEKAQTLICKALVTDEMGQQRWECLGRIWSFLMWLYISSSSVESYFSYQIIFISLNLHLASVLSILIHVLATCAKVSNSDPNLFG